MPTSQADVSAVIAAHPELSGAEKQKLRKVTTAQARIEQARRMRLGKQKKVEQKAAVAEKVRLGMPISDAERDMLDWSPTKKKAKTRTERENDLIAAASKLLIQPTHVKELRLLVEQTAAKYAYNPIEELILLTRPKRGETAHQVGADDRIAIHKALLPFLVPVLQAPKPSPEGQNEGTKVVITQYTFNDAPVAPIHEAAITKVDTTVEPPVPQ